MIKVSYLIKLNLLFGLVLPFAVAEQKTHTCFAEKSAIKSFGVEQIKLSITFNDTEKDLWRPVHAEIRTDYQNVPRYFKERYISGVFRPTKMAINNQGGKETTFSWYAGFSTVKDLGFMPDHFTALGLMDNLIFFKTVMIKFQLGDRASRTTLYHLFICP